MVPYNRVEENFQDQVVKPRIIHVACWIQFLPFRVCTPEGSNASACIYSLIETAKANGFEPYWYLKYLFENLPEAMTADEFMALMPQNIDKTLDFYTSTLVLLKSRERIRNNHLKRNSRYFVVGSGLKQ